MSEASRERDDGVKGHAVDVVYRAPHGLRTSLHICIYIYIYMYTNTTNNLLYYICIYIHICVYIYICMYTHMYIYIYTYTYIIM